MLLQHPIIWHRMEHYLTLLSGLLMPTIACIAVYIAWQQWRANKLRLKMDLFEKRSRIYGQTRDYLNKMIGGNNFSSQDALKYRTDTNDSVFLFKDAVSNKVEKLFKRGIRLDLLNRHLNNPDSSQADRKRYSDMKYELELDLIKESEELTELFSPYMDLGRG